MAGAAPGWGRPLLAGLALLLPLLAAIWHGALSGAAVERLSHTPLPGARGVQHSTVSLLGTRHGPAQAALQLSLTRGYDGAAQPTARWGLSRMTARWAGPPSGLGGWAAGALLALGLVVAHQRPPAGRPARPQSRRWRGGRWPVAWRLLAVEPQPDSAAGDVAGAMEGDPPLTTSAADQAAVAELKATLTPQPGGGETDDTALRALRAQPSVAIEVGTFKYVLIEAAVPSSKEVRMLVRGSCRASYHVDAARPTVTALQAAGCYVNVLGGGRIRHLPDAKRIEVFGFSYGFGPADHTVTQRLLLADPAFAGYTVCLTEESY